MKEEIKELRVKLDGLAQLTKNLTTTLYLIDSKSLEDIDAKEFLAKFEKYGRDVQPISAPKLDKVVETSKEIEKAYDSLILAKAWLGKILGELGDNTPYANDGNRKTVEHIEPAADKAQIVHGLREPFTDKNSDSPKRIDTWELNGRPMSDYDNMTHIQKVDWLREEIKQVFADTSKALGVLSANFNSEVSWDTIVTNLNAKEANIKLGWKNIATHLCEARFWLGFELQRIKEHGTA